MVTNRTLRIIPFIYCHLDGDWRHFADLIRVRGTSLPIGSNWEHYQCFESEVGPEIELMRLDNVIRYVAFKPESIIAVSSNAVAYLEYNVADDFEKNEEGKKVSIKKP